MKRFPPTRRRNCVLKSKRLGHTPHTAKVSTARDSVPSTSHTSVVNLENYGIASGEEGINCFGDVRSSSVSVAHCRRLSLDPSPPIVLGSSRGCDGTLPSPDSFSSVDFLSTLDLDELDVLVAKPGPTFVSGVREISTVPSDSDEATGEGSGFEQWIGLGVGPLPPLSDADIAAATNAPQFSGVELTSLELSVTHCLPYDVHYLESALHVGRLSRNCMAREAVERGANFASSPTDFPDPFSALMSYLRIQADAE